MKKSEANFRKLLEGISQSHDRHTVFSGFIRLAAGALACRSREAEYREEAKRWKADDMKMFSEALAALVEEMESKPFEDVLGAHYMEFVLSTKSQQWNGEFHTPKPICDLIARMLVGDGDDFPADRPITVCEPACGAGAMILSFAQACPPAVRRRLRVSAIDISRTACDMCFVNTTLWGIPARVIHGDVLAMKFWSAWSNVHFQMPFLSNLMNTQGQPPTALEINQIKASLVQPDLIPA